MSTWAIEFVPGPPRPYRSDRPVRRDDDEGRAGAESGGWYRPDAAHRGSAADRGNAADRGAKRRRAAQRRPFAEAPGVGLEPTTFRLTAGRVCQLSYPGSIELPGTGQLDVHSRASFDCGVPSLYLGMTVGTEQDALGRLGPGGV